MIYIVGFIDLNEEDLKLKCLQETEKMSFVKEKLIGFFPNGDLVIVSLRDFKIYLYPLKSKSTNNTP